MFLTRISINHPVFATMMMVMILVLGLFSYGRLGVDHYPETDLPVVVVATTYTGASPESVESEISRPIEAALNTIGGIDTITSESYEGRSIVVVQFEVDVDSQDAAQEVRDRVARLETKFPDGVATPQVTRYKPEGQAILSVAVSSTSRTLPEITTLATRVINNRLSVISGVGQVSLIGSSERQVLVVVDPDRLGAYGLAVSTVIEAIRGEKPGSGGGNAYIRHQSANRNGRGTHCEYFRLQPHHRRSKKRLSRLPFGSGNHSRHRRRSYQPCKLPRPDNSRFAHR